MRQVENGDVIRIHYTGKLKDDTEFDSSINKDPIQFEVGKGNLIPGIEKGVIGMEAGNKKQLIIPPEEAYGAARDDLFVTFEKKEFPSDINPQLGSELNLKDDNGNMVNAVISEVTEDTVTINANPPLAGETLIFDIELVEFVQN